MERFPFDPMTIVTLGPGEKAENYAADAGVAAV